MGLFEEIAVADLKFRIVLAAAVLAFSVVAFPIVFVFESSAGFAVGGLVAAVVGYLTAKRLA